MYLERVNLIYLLWTKQGWKEAVKMNGVGRNVCVLEWRELRVEEKELQFDDRLVAHSYGAFCLCEH